MAEGGPVLSVVVAAYTMDRLHDVYELLDSISAQAYRPIETLLIVEQSLELYQHLSQHLDQRDDLSVRVFFSEGKVGLSANRNRGICEARGEIIAFVDDDVILAPDWAEQVMETMRDEAVVGVTGPAMPLWLDESLRWLPQEFHWLISCTSWADWPTVREVRNVWGHNMAFRREAFARAGLFQTAVGLRGLGGPVAEDDEFSLRVRAVTGKSILYNPQAIVWHKVYRYRLGWRYIAERSYWIGRSRHLLAGSHDTRLRGGGQGTLTPEADLLKRILGQVPLRIGKQLLRNPPMALRQLWLVGWSLSFVALGYASGSLRRRQSALNTEPAVGPDGPTSN